MPWISAYNDTVSSLNPSLLFPRLKQLSGRPNPAFGRVTLLLFGLALAAGIFLPSHKARASITTIFLTSGSTWTVPPDWNSASNTIEVIGGGGGGSGGSSSNEGGDGGGGAAYSKITNLALTPGATVTYAVGAGGAGGAPGAHGGDGGDTYFCDSTGYGD